MCPTIANLRFRGNKEIYYNLFFLSSQRDALSKHLLFVFTLAVVLALSSSINFIPKLASENPKLYRLYEQITNFITLR